MTPELQGLPDTIGRYEVRGLLGRGGMGRVVRGHDPVLHRDVALKLVEPNGVPEDSSAEIRFLFHREARATAALRHPNIIEVYDYSGPEAPLMFLACELVEAPTLRDILDKKTVLPPAVAASLVYELAQALAHAHAQGIVHRDLKPENVFWLDTGRIVLADFGIAKALDGARLGGTVVFGQTNIYGSPAYMAPEQMAGAAVGLATDVHALGALFYELLSGRQAFDGPNAEAILAAVSAPQRPSLAESTGVPSSLVTLVHQMLRQTPADRPDAPTIVRALRTALDGLGVTDPRLTLADHGDATAALSVADDEPVQTTLLPRRSIFQEPPRRSLLAGGAPVVTMLLAVGGVGALVAFLFLRMNRIAGNAPPQEQSAQPLQPTPADRDLVFALVRFPGTASVLVDGKDVGSDSDQIRIASPPGPHVLEVRFPSGSTKREVMLLAGSTPVFDFAPPEK